jgi:hypothetical protein
VNKEKTVTDKDKGPSVSLLNVNCSEDIGTGNMAIPEDENRKRSNKDIK